MNRRNFFQTLLAGIAAIFLPKRKKAEWEPLVFEDSSIATGYADGEDIKFDYSPCTIATFYWCPKCDVWHTEDHHKKENQNG